MDRIESLPVLLKDNTMGYIIVGQRNKIKRAKKGRRGGGRKDKTEGNVLFHFP